MAWITALSRTLQNRPILRFSPAGIGCSQRHKRISGWMPIERSSLTECWVGLVFISPAVLMKGKSVRWTKQEWPRGSSWPSWRMASKNGRPSISPTVPPISTRTKSTSEPSSALASDSTNFLISSVTWGITWTVGAQIVAAPLLLQNGLVDAAGGDVVALGRRDAGEALIVTQIEVGLGPVVGDEDLAVLIGAHRPRIDIEIGVQLAQTNLVTARLQERTEGGGRETFSEGGDHAAGDEDVPGHGVSDYP